MMQNTTANDVTAMATYLQSKLDQMHVFSYGEEPEMQVDFHIPCEEENIMLADTLSAMVPCVSRQHTASAFKAGEYVQLSLHKEPSSELAEAFFQEALGRIATDEALAKRIAQQIEVNRELEAKRVQARMERLEKLRAKAATQPTTH